MTNSQKVIKLIENSQYVAAINNFINIKEMLL